MANKTITQLDAAQSLNDNMVIAVQDTNTTYKTTLADVKAYCGAAPAGDKYKVGDRVTDDSDNDVGMVSGFFTDGNGDRYAVVCLNAVDRLASGQYLSSNVNVTGIPSYTDLSAWSATETATTNTTAILAMTSYTSSACTHCRSKSYTIDGVTYAGQLPNIAELADIFKERTKINSDDTTASANPSLIIPTATDTWSSNKRGTAGRGWYFNADGGVDIGYGQWDYMNNITQNKFIIPVLEIPL